MNPFVGHYGLGNDCTLYSFSMCLGVEPPVLISEIGHNGRAELWQELEGQNKIRGFHPQEFYDSCISRRMFPVFYELDPRIGPDEGHAIRLYEHAEAAQRFKARLVDTRAVIFGLSGKVRHAVAWDGRQIHDPMMKRIKSFNQFPVMSAVFLYPDLEINQS